MCEQISDLAGALERAVGAFDSSALEGSEAARLLDVFEALARFAAAGRLACVERVSTTRVWHGEGHRTVVDWIAERTGSSIGEAVADVQTAAALTELSATREALASGALSDQQVRAIASGATADPTQESSLLAAAAVHPVSELRRRAQMVRAAAAGEDAVGRIRATRYWRDWIDKEGAVRIEAKMALEDAGPSLLAMRNQADRTQTEAAKTGRRESHEAHMADAFCSLGPSGKNAARTNVNVHVDLDAFERGSVRPTERCEISGLGPISVAAARRMCEEPGGFLKLIVHQRGKAIDAVHLGRYIPQRLRSVLDAQDESCVITACTRRRGLEYDHRQDYADGGPTSADNLGRPCHYHHYLKTHHGYRFVEQGGVVRAIGPERPVKSPKRNARAGSPPARGS